MFEVFLNAPPEDTPRPLRVSGSNKPDNVPEILKVPPDSTEVPEEEAPSAEALVIAKVPAEIVVSPV